MPLLQSYLHKMQNITETLSCVYYLLHDYVTYAHVAVLPYTYIH